MNASHRQQCDGPLLPIAPKAIRYIKLGSGGEFARACFEGGYVGMSFHEESHADCAAGEWDKIRKGFLARGKAAGKATAHTKELRDFYSLGADALWVTFADAKLWWAFAEPHVEYLEGQPLPRRRRTIGPWRSTNLERAPLRLRDLSTTLTSTIAFRGTCCELKAGDYLVRRINGIVEPLAEEADALRRQTVDLAAHGRVTLARLRDHGRSHLRRFRLATRWRAGRN